ncbi:hypothetical protein Q9233_005073 [Columba guinea]|nr:hypothetical protein Q9233_005073 [Columba guinea]
MAQRGQPAPHAMAAKDELYSKVIPRRNRQHRAGTIKHGSSLEILLSMGFPKARALLKHVLPSNRFSNIAVFQPRKAAKSLIPQGFELDLGKYGMERKALQIIFRF